MIPVDNDTKMLSLTGIGNASISVTRKATTGTKNPKSGTNRNNMTELIKKNVNEPALVFARNGTDPVNLPTIAANESAIVKTNTAGTAISFLNMINVTVAEMNK